MIVVNNASSIVLYIFKRCISITLLNVRFLFAPLLHRCFTEREIILLRQAIYDSLFGYEMSVSKHVIINVFVFQDKCD